MVTSSRSHHDSEDGGSGDGRDHVPLNVEHHNALVRQHSAGIGGLPPTQTAMNEGHDVIVDPSPIGPPEAFISSSPAPSQLMPGAYRNDETAIHDQHFLLDQLRRPVTQVVSQFHPSDIPNEHRLPHGLFGNLAPSTMDEERAGGDLGDVAQYSKSTAQSSELFPSHSSHLILSKDDIVEGKGDVQFSRRTRHVFGELPATKTTDPLSRTEHISTSHLQESSSEDDEWDGFADIFEKVQGIPEREWVTQHPPGVSTMEEQSRDNIPQNLHHLSTDSPPPHSDSSHSGSSALPTKFKHCSLNDFVEPGMLSYVEISTLELHPGDFCLIQKISPDWEDGASKKTETGDVNPNTSNSTKTKRKEKHNASKRRRKRQIMEVEQDEAQNLKRPPSPHTSHLGLQHVSSTSSTEIILTDMDVLGGRGSGANKHPGNQKYWEKICENRPAYQACHPRDYITKGQIANRVFEYVRQGGGRFLERDTQTRVLYELPHQRVLEKIKQALREKYVPFSLR